jgi:hypothetical protein
MQQRSFHVLVFLATANLIVYAACNISISAIPSSGPEGIGAGLIGLFSVILSGILYGIMLNQSFPQLRRREISGRTLLVALLAVAPLLHFVVFQVLHSRLRQHPP